MKFKEKKTIEVDAVQWTGDNLAEMAEFLEGEKVLQCGELLVLKSIEEHAYPDDWIVKHVAGCVSILPCKVFSACYEKADCEGS